MEKDSACMVKYKNLIDRQIKWHDKKSKQYKKLSTIMRFVIFSCSTLITLVSAIGSTLPDKNNCITILVISLASLATFLETFLRYLKCEDLHVEYRDLVESLEHKKRLLLSETISFDDFIKDCEKLFIKNKNGWVKLNKEDKTKNSN